MNVGNFLELIRFRVAAGDEILKKASILKAPSIFVVQSTCPKLYKTNEFVCLVNKLLLTLFQK